MRHEDVVISGVTYSEYEQTQVGTYADINGSGYGATSTNFSLVNFSAYVTVSNLKSDWVKNTYRVYGNTSSLASPSLFLTTDGGTFYILPDENGDFDHTFESYTAFTGFNDNVNAMYRDLEGNTTVATVLLIKSQYEITEIANSITNTATLTYQEVDTGTMLVSGDSDDVADKDITTPLLIYTPLFTYGVATGVETRKWTYDFGSVGSFGVEIPFSGFIRGFGELLEVATYELIIRSWNEQDNVWVDEKTRTFLFYASSFDSSASSSYREVITAYGLTTSKIQIQINVQVEIESSTYYSNFEGYAYEFIIFPSGASVDIHPFKIQANTSGSSPVKIFIGENTYSLPVVDTSDASASPLRICLGENDIRAFKLA